MFVDPLPERVSSTVCAARVAWKELIAWVEADHGIDRLKGLSAPDARGRMRVGTCSTCSTRS